MSARPTVVDDLSWTSCGVSASNVGQSFLLGIRESVGEVRPLAHPEAIEGGLLVRRLGVGVWSPSSFLGPPPRKILTATKALVLSPLEVLMEHPGDAGYAQVADSIHRTIFGEAPEETTARKAITRARREGYQDGLEKGKEYKAGRAAGYRDGMQEAKREIRDSHWAFGYVGGHHTALSEVQHASSLVSATTAIAFLRDYHWDEFRPAMMAGIMPPGWTVRGGLRVAEEIICTCEHVSKHHRVNGSCKSCACVEFVDSSDA